MDLSKVLVEHVRLGRAVLSLGSGATKDVSGGTASPTEYTGVIKRVESTHGFVKMNSRSATVFFHKNDFDNDTWQQLSSGMRAEFCIGFSLNCPISINVKCLS